MRPPHAISAGCCLLIAVAVLLLNVDISLAAAADRSDAILTVKAQKSSKEAIAALERHFGESDHLFYLHGAGERDNLTVTLSFPGRLLVAPDQTKLKVLLASAHPGVTITAEPEAAIAFFQNATAPVAKVVGDHNELLGIIATKADMEPLRTGAVVRHSGDDGDHGAAQTQDGSGKGQHDRNESHAVTAKSTPESTVDHGTGHEIVADQSQHNTNGDGHPAPETSESTNDPKTAAPAAATSHQDDQAAPAHTAASATASHGGGSQKTDSHAAPESSGAHAKGEAATGGHGDTYPTIDPSLPTGAAFMDAVIAPMDFELASRFWGWRPNDLIRIWDNVEHFQLGGAGDHPPHGHGAGRTHQPHGHNGRLRFRS